jgi:UDP-N-acetylmuramoylalanine--D-glutamate ligase
MTLKQAIQSFTSLPHRLEFVAEKNGVAYYNDSQGTTPEASIAAMRSFPDREIILLAGGSEKGVEFGELATEILTQKVTQLILFPPTGEKIEAAVSAAFLSGGQTQSSPAIQHVTSMQQAVTLAAQAAQPGNIVLLSPACASFGLFKNYQDRGDQFKAAVQLL